jgi:TetR/AcrR family tetracycline transcriptional repressor
MADELIADLPLPEAAGRKGWRRVIREYALAYYHQLLGKRDAGRILATRFGVAPNFLSHAELLGEHLLRAGFSTKDAANAIYTIVVYIQGFVCHQQAPAAVPAGPNVRLLSLSPAEFPAMATLVGALTKPDAERRFTFGLDRLLDGLEMMNAQKSHQTRRRSSFGYGAEE